MFLEALEPRQVMAGLDDPGAFAGNYYPQVKSQAAQHYHLSNPASGNAFSVGLNYLQQNAGAYGLTSGYINQALVTDQYSDADDGTTHIYLQQTYNGLPVADAVASVHVTAFGQVIAASANFVPNLVNTGPGPKAPSNSPLEAIAAFSAASGYPTPGDLTVITDVGGYSQQITYDGGPVSLDPITVQLDYVPKASGGVELAWSFTVRTPDQEHWYEISVGARFDERLNEVIRVVDYRDDATYNVFAQPISDPNDGVRTLLVDPHRLVASPFGWHDTNGVVGAEFLTTQGNNIFAQEDTNGDNLLGNRPTGGAALLFDFPLVLTGAPATYLDAAITNLFYWSNLMHDVSFEYGFDEPAGNFQITNYSATGLGNDQVFADAQDSSTLNNANMLTPPDGTPPRLNMGLSSVTTPFRDRDLQSFTVVHEYTHGITNRLTGGPANSSALNALQSGGMGEGWSDWMALVMTSRATDVKETAVGYGPYVVGLPATSAGIRRQPYSYDFAIDPRTFADFNGGFPNNQVHNAGEIWASTLWDMTWLLIEKHGYGSNIHTGTGGQNIALDLVFDGLKTQPANPSFIEARDAILAADLAQNSGANRDEIWQAFARRGLGFSASTSDSSSDIVNVAFDLPPILAGIQGIVYEDSNGDKTQNNGEPPLSGVTVYIDANNNGSLSAGELSVLSGTDGSYSLTAATAGTYIVREVVPFEYKLTQPSSGFYQINVSARQAAAGQSVTGKNFGNQPFPGEIRGIKFSDANGDGDQDAGELGIAGVMIYVDFNENGKINLFEPNAITDAFGNYAIKDVRPGTWQVREVAQPGLIQTFPDPADAATLGGAQVDVIVTRNKITSQINFGNRVAVDWGDLPDDATHHYHTLAANSGASAGILPGFGLTLTTGSAVDVVDLESNGIPTLTATGDDTDLSSGFDDENGVFIPALNPGSTSQLMVGVRTGVYSRGYLQAWFDYNRDGDFDDSGEHALTDLLLGTGVHTIPLNVPANASLGQTYARFRYGYEQGAKAKSSGAYLAGEVEDYVVNFLSTAPIANPDVFPRAGLDPAIRVGQTNVPLDVLANDVGSNANGTSNPPQLVGVSTSPGGPFTSSITLPGGQGIVSLNPANVPPGAAAGTLLVFTPGPGAGSSVTFFYQITDGFSTSATSVVVNITPPDPQAVDDVAFATQNTTTAVIIPVLDNDRPIVGSTQITSVSQVSSTPSPTVLPTIVQGTSTTNDTLSFIPPAGFSGTIVYQYTISTPGIADSTALVTVQVTPAPQTPSANHDVQFTVQYLDLNNAPITSINQGEDFFVRVFVQDFEMHAVTEDTEGAETAYIDLLIQNIGAAGNARLVEPVILPDASGTGLRYDIVEFDPEGNSSFTYTRLVSEDPTLAAPNMLNEVGAAIYFDGSTGSHPPIPNGPVRVMTIRFHANATATGQVRIQPDHADAAGTAIVLQTAAGFPNFSVTIPDENVFLPQAPTLNVVVPLFGGEGFTNTDNPNDVNVDTRVNAQDILAVISDLSINGARSLGQMEIGLSGKMPSGYLDANRDEMVNVFDILSIINYMTASGGGAGEGEGEAAAPEALVAQAGAETASGTETGSAADEAVKIMVADEPQADPADAGSAGSGDDQVFYTTTSATEPRLVVDPPPAGQQRASWRRTQGPAALDADAADELFSKMNLFREQLRQRIVSRRR